MFTFSLWLVIRYLWGYINLSQTVNSNSQVKDFRAHCCCASLLRTQIHTPRHAWSERAKQENEQWWGKWPLLQLYVDVTILDIRWPLQFFPETDSISNDWICIWMNVYLYTAHITSCVMVVYNSIQGDRTSACEGASGRRYHSKNEQKLSMGSLKKNQDFCPRDIESYHLATARCVKLWSLNSNLFFKEPHQLTKLI